MDPLPAAAPARFPLIAGVFIVLTVLFAVAGQVVMRWQMAKVANPADGALAFATACASNLWMWLVVAFAFMSMACWAVVLNRIPLSLAYPFTALSFVGVLLASRLFLNEVPSVTTMIGVLVICLGVGIVGWGAR